MLSRSCGAAGDMTMAFKPKASPRPAPSAADPTMSASQAIAAQMVAGMDAEQAAKAAAAKAGVGGKGKKKGMFGF